MDENEKSKRLERIKKEKSAKQMILLISGVTIGVLATTGILVYRASQTIPADAGPKIESAPVVAASDTKAAENKPAPEPTELSEANGERLAAATALLRVNDQGQQLHSCGFFCAPETIMTDAALFGECTKAPAFNGTITVVIYSGMAGKQVVLKARLTAIDADAHLAFVKVSGANLPEPLEFVSASSIKGSVPLYVSGISVSKPTDAPPVGITPGTAGTLTVRRSGTALATVNAALSTAHRGAPVVDCKCRVVGMIPGNLRTTKSCSAIPTEDMLWSLNGHVCDVVLKPVSKSDSVYTFQVSTDVINPTEGPLAVNFYYKLGGRDNPDNTVALKIDAATKKYTGEVTVNLPRAGNLWAQTGIALASNPESRTPLYDRAAEIGVPGAIVVEAPPVQQPPVYQYAPQPTVMVQQQPTVRYVQDTVYNNSSNQTVTRTVITNPTPPPPADSPGWTFGYKADNSTNVRSGQYETAPDNSRRNPGVIIVTPPPAQRR